MKVTKSFGGQTFSGWFFVCLIGLGVLAPQVMAEGQPPLAYISVGEYGMEWMTSEAYPALTLRVSGPDGAVFEGSFNSTDAPPVFDFYTDEGDLRPNGQYRYELIAYPKIDKKTRALLALARESEERDAVVRELQSAGKLPKDTISQTGDFQFENGTASFAEPHTVTTVTGSDTDEPTVTKDQVIPDDLVTQGSTCTGLDCVNNENFSFDTLRLKENNLRIHFDDTSATAGFAANDWRIVANGSNSGEPSYLAFEDATAARQVFLVEAGAPSNALYVDDGGRVGLRTSTPVLDLHISTGNTPAMRLEQTGGSGFTPQTWDVAGNEANFFVRDVNGGSLLPFKIRPGTPTGSLDLTPSVLVVNEMGNNYDTRIESDTDPNMFFVDASADKIGVGLANPAQTFQVEKSNDGGNTTVWVKNTSNTANSHSRFYTQVSGAAAGDPKCTLAVQGGTIWEFGLDNSDSDKFKISRGNDLGGNNHFTISTAGNVGINNSNPGALLAVGNGGAVCNGTTWTDGSSRDYKKNIEPLSDADLQGLMTVLDEVDMVSFQYKQEPDSAPERVGVIAEELPDVLASADHKGLELGRNVGFLMGVVKALKAENDKNAEMIAELKAEIEALKTSR